MINVIVVVTLLPGDERFEMEITAGAAA